MNHSRTPLALLFFIALATLAIYLRTLAFDFVAYDDGVYVTDNPTVSAGLTWNGVAYAFTTGETGTWQPLTLLSHMLDCSIYGQNAAGHHATNALLHALNTLLLGLALLRMTGSAGPSLFAAAVFGLHPLHVESVAWVSERKDVLSTFFFLAALYAYAVWAESLHKRWMLLATGSMALGLLAKPMLVTLPFVLLLLDYWPLHRVDHDNKARCIALLAAEKLPMFLLAFASSAATILAQRGAWATSSLEALPLALRFENAAVAYVRYAGKSVWPADLLMYYPHPRGSLSALAVGAAVLCLIAVTITAWFLRHRSQYLIVGWFWYLGTLVPVIGLVQVGAQAIADRYTYIPMIGLLVMVTWGARDLAAFSGARVGRRVLPALSAAAIVVLAALTWPQIGVWRNSETLYRHTLDADPDNPVANMGIGLLLVKQKQYADAIPYLEMALQKKHREADAHYHLGIAHQETRMYRKAAEHYRAAIEVNPGYSQAWNNLGVTLDALGANDEALAAFERAVATGPRNEEAALNLVRYLIRLDKYDEARQRALDASDRFPHSADIEALVKIIDANAPKRVSTSP
jgi:tetratricopeptide (TPR) repeat protein